MPLLIALFAVSLLVGVALARRVNYLVLIPATIVTLLVTYAAVTAEEYSLGSLALASFLNVTGLQAGYLGGATIRPRSLRFRRFSGQFSRVLRYLHKRPTANK